MLALYETVNIDKFSDENMYLLSDSVAERTILHSNIVEGLYCRHAVVVSEPD